ncbi:MAG TPA: hypothetical protein VID27_23065, partial [Blastocatellia bacterium]
MGNAQSRSRLSALILILILTLFPSIRKASASLQIGSDNLTSWTSPNALGVFVRKAVGGRAVCFEASMEQARNVRERNIPLTQLTFDADPSRPLRTGLRVILRGT